MSNYWPTDLDLADTSNPSDILQAASREWEVESDGLLTLVIQETISSNKNQMFIVHAKHLPSNRTATLFSVVHRPKAPYPARIQPKGDELPDLFKKSYYKPGIADLTSSIQGVAGRRVTNEWVCDTPSEFRDRLEEVFNLGTLKSDVLSLVSGSSLAEDVDDEGEPDSTTDNSEP